MAWLLDGLIFTAIYVGLGVLIVGVTVALPREDPQLCEDIDGNVAICEPLTGGSVAVVVILALAIFIGFLVFLIYFWMGKLVGVRGQTPGRMAMSIKVVGRMTGQPVGMGKGIGRGFMSWISALPCYLGFLWMLWDDNNQTWHDKVVDSIVIVDR